MFFLRRGEEDRGALPPLLGRCLPFACRRGFQPVAPILCAGRCGRTAAPVSAEITAAARRLGGRSVFIIVWAKGACQCKAEEKVTIFPGFFREIPVSLTLFLGQFRG